MATPSVERWRNAAGVAGLLAIVGLIVAARVIATRPGLSATSVWTSTDVRIGYTVGVVAPVAYLVPGAVLLLRRQWHPVGWLLCLIACSEAASFSSDWTQVRVSGGTGLYWLLNTIGDWSAASLLVALLVLFPDGLTGRPTWQRRIDRLLLAVAAVAIAVTVLAPSAVSEDGTVIGNPLGLAVVPPRGPDVAGAAVLIALLVAFLRMVLRFRSSSSVARLQYRWVLYAIAFVVVAQLIGLVGVLLAERAAGIWWIPFLLSLLWLPAAFMVAILRYRLYEIDRIVSRTVAYTIVLVLLASVYATAIGVLTLAVPLPSDVAVAAATLAIAALFNPLTQRVRRLVDRRFNRSRFDAGRELNAFARRLQARPTLGDVETDLVAVIAHMLQPTGLTVWLRDQRTAMAPLPRTSGDGGPETGV